MWLPNLWPRFRLLRPVHLLRPDWREFLADRLSRSLGFVIGFGVGATIWALFEHRRAPLAGNFAALWNCIKAGILFGGFGWLAAFFLNLKRHFESPPKPGSLVIEERKITDLIEPPND